MIRNQEREPNIYLPKPVYRSVHSNQLGRHHCTAQATAKVLST